MSALVGNIAIDPAILGNLRGLTDVDLQIQTDLARAPSYLGPMQLAELQRQAEWRLAQASIRVHAGAAATLVISIAVELRMVPQLGGMSALFAVGTTLREACLLPRVGSSDGRYADMWRHKESTGIIAHDGGASQGVAIIMSEALKQIDGFVASWRREAAVAQVVVPAVIAGAGLNPVAPIVAGPAVVAAPVLVPSSLAPSTVVAAPLTSQIPTQSLLDDAVGKHISAFCGNPFHDDDVSHCAHFVGHLLRLRAGTTCRDVAGGSAEGASIRVHEVFANCLQVGRWDELPTPLNWGLIFVTNPANVDLAGRTMANVANKHVGIFFGADRAVYQYKNAVKKVIRQTPMVFKAHYGAPDDGLFWGTI
jgi:hypothetical protein